MKPPMHRTWLLCVRARGWVVARGFHREGGFRQTWPEAVVTRALEWALDRIEMRWTP